MSVSPSFFYSFFSHGLVPCFQCVSMVTEERLSAKKLTLTQHLFWTKTHLRWTGGDMANVWKTTCGKEASMMNGISRSRGVSAPIQTTFCQGRPCTCSHLFSPVSLQKYRYQDDEAPPVDPSPGHMTQGRSTELSHAHLDGYTHPAALTVRTRTETHTAFCTTFPRIQLQCRKIYLSFRTFERSLGRF